MHLATHRAVPLRLWVQWEVPHHNSHPHLLVPIWQLHWQQPAGEEKAEVRFKSIWSMDLQSNQLFWFDLPQTSLLFSMSSNIKMLKLAKGPFCESISAVLTNTVFFQSVWEDSFFMESSLCKSDRLLKPSVPAQTQPGTGSAPAIYRPPLFQVGQHSRNWLKMWEMPRVLFVFSLL